MAKTRRDFLRTTSSLGAAMAAIGLTSEFFSFPARAEKECFPARAEDEYGNEVAALRSKWMREVIETRALVNPLQLQRFADPFYIVLKPISWKPNNGQEAYNEVTVPKGFVTDLTSVPRAFWALLPRDGDYTYAAIIHDYLYWAQTQPKSAADKILEFAMEDLKIGNGDRYAIYLGVDWFGEQPWKSNASLKNKGEKRVLKNFPADPTVTWKEWKNDPNNFE